MAELARYQVRTPMLLWMVNGLITALAATAIGAVVMIGGAPISVLVLVAVLASATVAFWFTMSAYRVGGGRNLIRIHEDRIEVPAVRERKPIVFRREALQLAIKDVTVQYRLGLAPIANMSRGKLIELSDGKRTRKLSTLVLDDRNDERALVADLERFVAGEAPLGRAGHDAPAPRTEYDDRLDRELAQLD